MGKKIFGALLLSGILAFSAPGITQDENGNGAPEGEPDAVTPEVRRGFSWEPGFSYRPGFPTERRTQEEFGVSPEFEEEAAPEEEMTDPPPGESATEEELGVSPAFDGESLPPAAPEEIEPGEEDDWIPHPDSRIDPSDPLEPERTIQR